MSNSPDNVAGKERRKPWLDNLAKEIPQLLIVFAFHLVANLTNSVTESCARYECDEALHLGSFQEAFQLPNPRRMPHFSQGLGLDLSNSFPSDSKLAPNLFQGPAVAVDQAETLFENLPFSFGQSLEHVLDLLLEQHDGRHIGGIFGALVFDKIAKISFLAFTNRGLKRDRLLGHF